MLETLFASLNEGKKCSIFLGLQLRRDPPNVFETNQICSPTTRFARILPNIKNFLHHWSMQIFFTSEIDPDILMNVLEDCIILLIWAARV